MPAARNRGAVNETQGEKVLGTWIEVTFEMDLVIAFIIFSGAMIGSLICDFSMLWSLLAGFAGFMGVGVHRGFALTHLLRMAWDGMKASFIVIRVMLTIGVLTGLWRSAGTFAVLTA